MCIYIAPLTEESWEARHKQIINGDEAVQIASGDEYYNYPPDAETIITEEALDLLTAEDPAVLSDDFSNPDDFFDEDEYDDFSEDDDDDVYIVFITAVYCDTVNCSVV